jgi:1-acyl-sn-glycerol-3-phosphate acyltransferase
MVLTLLRSAIFSIAFFIFTLGICLSYAPAVILPRERFLPLVAFYLKGVYCLERLILGLSYEVRGGEHLPQSGAYLVAAKHFSAYETFKLVLLFGDPAIILKKELLSIPLWGWYLGKTKPIAIDRSKAKNALSSMLEGAQRIKDEGRPLVIFPQGTRVRVEETPAEKPYKSGIARIQAATELPVIPMATNSGYYAPRKSWIKKSGTVIFEFLPPLHETGDELMKTLEEKLEAASNALIDEAKR